ncbi:MAG: NAD(P)/FAD-dependent oxidoreductase [Pseudomonadales bacterium]
MSDGIVVAGGGFAGLWAALAARREADVPITVVNRDEYLTIRPRLYEADPATLRVALAETLDPVGINLIVADIECGVIGEQRLLTSQGEIGFDRLVLVTGSRVKPLPVPGAERCYDIDSFRGASAFDARLATLQPGDRVVIIGAGFTGIELATELRPRLAVRDPALARGIDIVLLDIAEVVGQELGCHPRPVIEQALDKARVEVWLGSRVEEILPDGIRLADGRRVAAAAVVNCAGLQASPSPLPGSPARDESGRLLVDGYLQVLDRPGVFAAGDAASAVVDDQGHRALMSCQHALVMGRYAGFNAARSLLGRPLATYRQERYVTCLDLGASGAVFTRGWERQVVLTGEEAGALKRDINTQRIYPPTEAGEILRQAALPES